MAQVKITAEQLRRKTIPDLNNDYEAVAQAIRQKRANNPQDPLIAKWTTAQKRIRETQNEISRIYDKCKAAGFLPKDCKKEMVTLAELGQYAAQHGKGINDNLQDISLSNSLADKAEETKNNPDKTELSSGIAKWLLTFSVAEFGLSALGAGGVFGAIGTALPAGLDLIGKGIAALWAVSPVATIALAAVAAIKLTPVIKRLWNKITQKDAKDLASQLSTGKMNEQDLENGKAKGDDTFYDLEQELEAPALDDDGNGGGNNGGKNEKKDEKSKLEQIIEDNYPKFNEAGKEIAAQLEEGEKIVTAFEATVPQKDKETGEFNFSKGEKEENGKVVEAFKDANEIGKERDDATKAMETVQAQLNEVRAKIEANIQEMQKIANEAIKGTPEQQFMSKMAFETAQQATQKLLAIEKRLEKALGQYQDFVNACTKQIEYLGGQLESNSTAVVPVQQTSPKKDNPSTSVVTADGNNKPKQTENGAYNPNAPTVNQTEEYSVDPNLTIEQLKTLINGLEKKIIRDDAKIQENAAKGIRDDKLVSENQKRRQIVASAKKLLTEKEKAKKSEIPLLTDGTEKKKPVEKPVIEAEEDMGTNNGIDQDVWDDNEVGPEEKKTINPESKKKLQTAYQKFQKLQATKTNYKYQSEQKQGFGYVKANTQTGEPRKYTVIDEMGLDQEHKDAMYALLDAVVESRENNPEKQTGAQLVEAARKGKLDPETAKKLDESAKTVEGLIQD